MLRRRTIHLRYGALAAGLVPALLGVGGSPPTGAATAPGATAAVVPDPALLGSAPEQAAGSCWEIRRARPTAGDGAYWLLTPAMAEPRRFYCDQTTDGGGWVLVGKGRNAWTVDDAGRGSATALLSPAYAGATDTHQHSATLIDQLLDGGRVVDLADGIRVRRAMDAAGTRWQEVRFRPDTRQTGWSWAWGARFDVGSWSFAPADPGTTSPIAGSGGQTDAFGTGTSWTRVRTGPSPVTGWSGGYAYDDQVTGTSSTGSHLWAPADGGARAIPVAQVYLRPQVTSEDPDFDPVPNAGTPKQEWRALPRSDADVLPWGVAGLAGSTGREGNVEVQELLPAHGRIYLGGNFQFVQRDAAGTGQVTQPFLAAFDLVTGEWVSSFRPVLDEQVRALALSPTGAIIAGGDFHSANGAPATAIVALDPDTGATDPSFRLTIENRIAAGLPRVWALERLGGFLYLGGEMTHLQGGPSVTPAYMRNLARVRIADGRTSGGWNPEMTGSVVALDGSADRSRIYAAGHFNTSRGVATRKAAAVLTTFVTRPDGTVEHLASPQWAPTWSAAADYQQAVVEAHGNVWTGGSEHSVFGFDGATFQRFSSTILHAQGDVQTMHVRGDVLFAGSHANNRFAFTGATTWSGAGAGGEPWTAAHSQHWIGAYDAHDGESLGDFAPSLQMRKGSGIWASVTDTRGRLWVGGDLESARTASGPATFAGGFTRFAPRDTTAPARPTGFRATRVTRTSVTLAWRGPAGARFQVLRHDRPIVTTTATSITLALAGPPGATRRFFVRAADVAGNLSASTSVLPVTVPAG